ncbi:MAG TPA: hypothetical protein VHO70_10365 [Chitinispirillaceae bacterium]|nr:hypothetical protein [Chitinispirillaceae bacterium]
MKPFIIEKQPDDITCGPTCLHAVYSFYDDPVPLPQVIEEVPSLQTGGTLAVFLACHALKRGYDASLYVYNLQLFDPTWFRAGAGDFKEKLSEQILHKQGKRLTDATHAYLEYLDLGGKVYYQDLTPELISGIVNNGTPILTGLSATYLYDCAREREVTHHKSAYDDIRGTPTGHFVIITDIEPNSDHVLIADPNHDNPLFKKSNYTVRMQKLINSIMLGIITYDANLLIIQPKPNEK